MLVQELLHLGSALDYTLSLGFRYASIRSKLCLSIRHKNLRRFSIPKIHDLKDTLRNNYSRICLVGRLSNRTILQKVCLTRQFLISSFSLSNRTIGKFGQTYSTFNVKLVCLTGKFSVFWGASPVRTILLSKLSYYTNSTKLINTPELGCNGGFIRTGQYFLLLSTILVNAL